MEFDRLGHFRKAYRKLSQENKDKVEKALRKFDSNPIHPSLHVEKISADIWSFRASDSLRVTFEFVGNLDALREAKRIILRNVGQHDVYEAP